MRPINHFVVALLTEMRSSPSGRKGWGQKVPLYRTTPIKATNPTKPTPSTEAYLNLQNLLPLILLTWTKGRAAGGSVW